MFLFLKLVITMGKSASLSVRTASCGAEGPTKFSLDFDFVVLRHNPSVIFERKWIALLSLISLVTTFKLFATKEFVLVLNLINYAAHLVVKRLLSIRIWRDLLVPNCTFWRIKGLCFGGRHSTAALRVLRLVCLAGLGRLVDIDVLFFYLPILIFSRRRAHFKAWPFFIFRNGQIRELVVFILGHPQIVKCRQRLARLLWLIIRMLRLEAKVSLLTIIDRQEPASSWKKFSIISIILIRQLCPLIIVWLLEKSLLIFRASSNINS